MMRGRVLTTVSLGLFFLGSCAQSDEAPMAQAEKVATTEGLGGLGAKGSGRGGGGLAPGAPSPKVSRSRAPKKKMKRAKDAFASSLIGGMEVGADLEADEVAEAPEDDAATTRAWFPETFLFEPALLTDASGNAEISVKVPDRLTTWRVLALAHDQHGAQAGAVSTFLGTLPTYVDPIVPGFLMAGDVVDLPIQVVNTSEQSVRKTLKLNVEGAALVKAAGEVTLPPQRSVVRFARVRVGEAGTLSLRASLGDKDAVERQVAVYDTGKPMEESRSGTLAAPRTLSIELPKDAGAARARLQVFPGALALLRSELSVGLSRGGAAQDAYMLMLAGRAQELLTKLGAKADAKRLRKLRLVATQRVMRHARSPAPGSAAMLTEAALSHPKVPVLSRLGERLAGQVARSQRPDGTFSGASGWTLQRLLVATAEGLRAVRAAAQGPAGKSRARGAAIKANGAFERNLARIEDPYTAAAILASGAVEGSTAKRLQKRVREAIVTRESGAKALPVPKGAVRPDGLVPSEIEATALAVLALKSDPEAKALLPDLGARLLSAYTPAAGFGDGRASLAALMAVLEIFKDPLPPKVQVRLLCDDRVIAQGVLQDRLLQEVLTLDAQALKVGGTHAWRVESQPAVPGLGYSLAIRYHTPWKLEAPKDGLELQVQRPTKLKVGRPIDVALAMSAPSLPVKIRHAIPAGIQPDRLSLEALVSAGTITRFSVEDGAVLMYVPALVQGQSFVGRYRLVPTLSGSLRASASSVEVQGRESLVFYTPPKVWEIAR